MKIIDNHGFPWNNYYKYNKRDAQEDRRDADAQHYHKDDTPYRPYGLYNYKNKKKINALTVNKNFNKNVNISKNVNMNKNGKM